MKEIFDNSQNVSIKFGKSSTTVNSMIDRVNKKMLTIILYSVII